MSAVDIIIPTKGKTNYLFKCLQSIIDNTTVPYHVHIADTGSTSKEYHDIVKFLATKFRDKKNASLYKYTYYNFAKINNHVVDNYCESDTLLFCNNDIELIDSCVDELYAATRDDAVGTAGCRLLFEDGSVQHAGQLAFTHRPNGWQFPQDKLEVTHRGLRTRKRFKPLESVMGNTAALMCVRRDVFDRVKGFNTKYNECFEDVEFNMKVRLAGFSNIYNDTCEAIHAESVSRGKSPASIEREGRDFYDNLFPYWCSLSKSDQRLIKSFNETESKKAQLT